MKRSVSDILDDIQVNNVELENTSPLSSQRIKELTMKKITVNKPKRRIFSKALLAAAVLAMLTVTAVAVEIWSPGEWFRDIFRSKGSEDNLQTRVEFVDQTGKLHQQSMTSEGTTVTPLAGYGDENICHLRLKVTGPEGTVLPDDLPYRFFGSWDQAENLLENPDLYEGLWVLPDEDPGDNEKEFLIKVMAMPEAKQKLNDGSPVPYHIYGLHQTLPYEEGKPEFTQILPGEFTLDLSVCNQIEMTELDVEGISYHREEIGTQHNLDGTREEIPYDYTVTFSSMRISPLSLSWTCDYEMSDLTWKAAPEIRVILKDGTDASLQWGRGSGTSEDHHVAFSKANAFFDVPIDLADIDHILIGEEHRIEIPRA